VFKWMYAAVAAGMLCGCADSTHEAQRAQLLSISEANYVAHSKLQQYSDEEEASKTYVVYFDSGSSTVSEETAVDLKYIAQVLIDNPSVELIVEGHTDSQGGFQDNIVLGQARATAIRNCLVEQGVLLGQVQVVSYADLYPAQLGEDEIADKRNRRAVMEFQGLRG